MTKQTKILTGVLAGVALGAVVALVVSGDSKNELKEKVGDWFAGLLDASKDKFAGVSNLVKDTVAKVQA